MAQFGTSVRPNLTKSAVYAEQLQKERELAFRAADHGDALDEFVIEVAGKQPSAAAPPPPASVVSHGVFLQKSEATGRLVNGNVFPAACFVGRNNRWMGSRQAEDNARPWRMMQYQQDRNVLTPLNKQHYHMPNQFGEEVAAAARMGLKMFGARGA